MLAIFAVVQRDVSSTAVEVENAGSHSRWEVTRPAESIVVAPGVDVAAEVERRVIEQSVLDKSENVQDAARTPIAVGKRMDRLELVVLDRYPDQRIEICALVDEALPVGEQPAQMVLSLGGMRIAYRRYASSSTSSQGVRRISS